MKIQIYNLKTIMTKQLQTMINDYKANPKKVRILQFRIKLSQTNKFQMIIFRHRVLNM